MFQDYISKCVFLHYCANINIDKNLWDKFKKRYKKEKEKEKVLAILEIDPKTNFQFSFGLGKVKKGKSLYHFVVNIESINQNDLKKIKAESVKKGINIVEQSIKKTDIIQQMIGTTQKIQCHEGHIVAHFHFKIKKFRSTLGIPFPAPAGILSTDPNIGKVTIEALDFAFEDSISGLQKARIGKEDKYFCLRFILNKDIMLDENFLQNLSDSTNGLCPLFIEEIK